MAFDPLNLLLLAIAVIVFWRLKSVLGSRTGHERPPAEPPAQRDKTGSQEPANGNVLRFPREDQPPPAARPAEDAPASIWTGYAEPGSDLARSLEQIAAADPAFSPKQFLEGAKLAYEMIIEAFAKGDKQSLKPLLSKEVFEGFAVAIDQRLAAGQSVEQKFVGIDKAAISAAAMLGRKASVTVRFLSELISVTKAKDGSVVEGDAKQIRGTSDVWTFERDTSSHDPNWKLVATQEPV